jgi:hypothetical protein
MINNCILWNGLSSPFSQVIIELLFLEYLIYYSVA